MPHQQEGSGQEEGRLERLQRLQRLRRLQQQRQAAAQGQGERPASIGQARDFSVGQMFSTAMETLGQNPPFPTPETISSLREQGIGGTLRGLASTPFSMAQQAAQSGPIDVPGAVPVLGPMSQLSRALFPGGGRERAPAPDDPARGGVAPSLVRGPTPGERARGRTATALGGVPLIGPMVQGLVADPLSRALFPEEGDDPRDVEAGRALGGLGSLAVEGVIDSILGGTASASRQARRASQARRVPLSLGQEPGAGGTRRMMEGFLERTTGGRPVFQRFRVTQSRQFVDNEVNRFLSDIAEFQGPKLLLGARVRSGLDNIIDGLREQNRDLYAQFDQALAEASTELGPRGRARGLRRPPLAFATEGSPGGAAVLGVDMTPAAEMAQSMLQQLRTESQIVADPNLRQLTGRVERLAGLKGRKMPVQAATDARSTLLKLARRLDNPLGSKEESIISRVFGPIDEQIESALREAGGDDLVEQWRTANRRVRQLHETVDETVFEEIVQLRDPAKIAEIVAKAPGTELANLKARLPGPLWDQTRTLLLKERLDDAIRGETFLPVRGGAQAARRGADGPENFLQVRQSEVIDPDLTADRLQEVFAGLEESKRSVLFTDQELKAAENLIRTAKEIAPNASEAMSLVGNGISAGVIIGAGAGITGLLTGDIRMATAGAAAALPAFDITTRMAAELFTNPQLANSVRQAIERGAQAGRVGAGGGFAANQIASNLSDEALAEFVAVNNIPLPALREDVRRRLMGQDQQIGPRSLMDQIRGSFSPFGLPGPGAAATMGRIPGEREQ